MTEANYILTKIDFLGPTKITGWAVDVRNEDLHLEIEVLEKDTLRAVLVANIARSDISSFLKNNCAHGFDTGGQALKIENIHDVRLRIKDHDLYIDIPQNIFETKIFVDVVQSSFISGWAWSPTHPEQRITVVARSQDSLLGYGIANEYREDLANFGIGDGRHGYTIRLLESASDRGNISIQCLPIATADAIQITASQIIASPPKFNGSIVEAPDAFALRGFEPTSSAAVIINAIDNTTWATACTSLEELNLEVDVFVLGSRDLSTHLLPSSIKSVVFAGAADDSGIIKNSFSLFSSNIFHQYRAVLWISPKDATKDENRLVIDNLIREGADFVNNADWGLASSGVRKVSKHADPDLFAAINTILPRLGLKFEASDLELADGSTVWMEPILFRGLAAAIKAGDIYVSGQDKNFPSRTLILALITYFAKEAMFGLHKPEGGNTERNPLSVKTIAFFLPQFHPIPENDKWWGKGFTEWSNVTKGRPLFRNHYQPRVPADLGYYDLRLEETQVAQAELASIFGIHGFCFYYYWFNGKKMLNQPIEQLVRSSKINTGFCVCWANENWSRNWDGQNRHVLLEQQYTMESNRALILELIPMMKDPRWIRYNGKPIMLVYRISIIPNWIETAAIWREECLHAGLGEIHLCAVRFGLEPLSGQPEDHGLDSYVLFPPHETSRKDIKSNVLDLTKDFGGEIFDYGSVVAGDIKRFDDGYEWPVHRGTMLGWDNTARRQTASRIFHGANPYSFRRWVKCILNQERQYNHRDESLLFVNAWNEWAEGTYLEPDQRWGTSYLEALKSAGNSVSGTQLVTLPPNTVSLPSAELQLSSIGLDPSKKGRYLTVLDWHAGGRKCDCNIPTVLVVAHVAGGYLFGGERSLLDVLEGMAKLTLNVIVALPSGNNTAYIESIKKVSAGIYVFPYPQWMDNRQGYAWVNIAFSDIIARHAVDIVHVNTIVLLEPLQAARRLGRSTLIHVRELVSLDDVLKRSMRTTTSEIIDAVFERADWVIGNSKATCDLFARTDRTLYVPNAVTVDDFDLSVRFGKTIKFGIVSSNIPKKGVEDFMEVAKRAAVEVPNARFVVVGPINEHTQRWESEIVEGVRPGNVQFLGYLDSPKKAMSELNVLLNLSNFAESFGRTVAEAMAARRPVIAYKWGALPELIIHEKTGYLVPYKDIDAVLQAVRSFCDDPGKILEMGNAGRIFISENFSQNNLQMALESAYGSIMRSDTIASDCNPRRTTRECIGQAKRTAIVVPIYNAFSDAEACVESVLKCTDMSLCRLIVIDDASSDDRVPAWLDGLRHNPNIEVVANSENIGYTRTINKGIQLAGDDDVVLLNSDTIVTPKWVEGLRSIAYSKARVATVTAMSDNAGAFSFPEFNKTCRKPSHISHDDYAILMVQSTYGCSAPEVPTGSGFCMFIRRSFMDEHGLFDEEAFPRGYGEENDFCMRALKAGWLNLISPWAFVFHTRTASFKGEKEALVKSGIDTVIRRYPDYSNLVKNAFASEDMVALRKAAAVIYERNIIREDKLVGV